MWKKLIEEALKNKAEYNYLDFKLKLSIQNERTKEHINAFGNLERGGCFVFGVDNFKIIGINENWDNIITKIGHFAKATQEPSLSVNAFPIEISGKELLCVHILPSLSKPVFIKDRAPLGGKACFKRSGSATVPMSIQEIKDLLISTTNNYYDESVVRNAKLEELDFIKLFELLPQLETDNYFSQKNIAILTDYRILTNGKQTFEITVAGWLCFAKNPQAYKQFRNAYIEFQIFQGSARNKPIKKYAIQGSLPEQIEQAIQLLQQNIWTVPKIQGIVREDVPAYTTQPLREIIANSVVHRDYRRMHQPVKIAMFNNRIEIENPGGLLPGLTIYNLIHKRDWRNPLLAELMKKFGFGEMDGQGIDRLYAATLDIKVPPPVFIDHENSFVVVLSAPKNFKEFSPEEKRLMVIILAIMHEVVDNE
ncbi:MAG: ATP-binding protein, partial [Bacteroidota bacterium]